MFVELMTVGTILGTSTGDIASLSDLYIDYSYTYGGVFRYRPASPSIPRRAM